MNNDSTNPIAGIDIPLKLVDAANKNELVIFAGAGVSSPGIPVFDELVEEAFKYISNKHDNITSLPEKPCVNPPLENALNKYADIKSLPEKLDRVQRDGSNAKQLVADLISKYQEKPENCSQNHQTLLKFFKDKDNIRIVTTNYDHNFHKAAQELGLESLQQYCQPILPLGYRFKGIVYLHGRTDDTDSMIMTQTDFSEAYLNHQRTRLFLQELFNQYTVLFVGYSFQDELIKYIFKSFNSKDFKDKAFALMPKDESENAEYLDINSLRTVGKVEKGEFVKQNEINEAESQKIWDRLKEQGVLDERDEINTEITINQDNINTWLDVEVDAVKSHVLGVLKQDCFKQDCFKKIWECLKQWGERNTPGLIAKIVAQETAPFDPSIWGSVIREWFKQSHEQSLTQDDVKQDVQFLLDNYQSLQAFHTTICQFLSKNAKVLKAHKESQTLADTIRDAIFNDQTIGPLARYEAGEESEEAINSSGFYLCDFYIRSIQYDQYDDQPISDDTLNRAVGSFFENQSYSAKMGRSALAYHLAFLYQKNKSWTIQNVLPLFNEDLNCEEATRSLALFILSNRWNEALLEQLLDQKKDSFINFKGLGKSRKIFCQQMAALAISVAMFRGETVLEKAWFQSFVGHCESDDFVFFAQGLSSVFHHLVKDETRDQSKKIEYLNKSWAVFLKGYVNNRHLGVPIKIESSECLALLNSGLYLMDASFSEFVETLSTMKLPLIKNLNPGHHRFVSKLQNQIKGKNKSAIAKLLIFLLDHGLVSSVEKQLFLDKLVQSIQDDISDDLKAELDARM
ncbi:SIR2 family protein [Candidatus Marinamargulisbacteria bacterium]|nr:SIR2 family protein [Candidatus Marinamargulisbacteria bacterium]